MLMKIWSYWEGDRPKIYDRCQDSWKKYASKFEINMLTPAKISDYNLKLPTTFDKLSPTTKSDVIRLNLLYSYGGVWLDATILLKKDLSWLSTFCAKQKDDDIIGYTGVNKMHMESWLIAVNQTNNSKINLWLDCFIDILNHHPNYRQSKAYKDCELYIKNENYFMMYQAFCYLKKHNDNFNYVSVPYSTYFAVEPFYIPLVDTRKLVKFTTAGRQREPYYRIGTIIIIIILIFVSMMMIKKYL